MRSTPRWSTAPTCSRRATPSRAIDVPEAEDAVNDYPLVVLAESPHPAAAQAFVDLVLSADGQDVLTGAGFQAP